MKIEASTPEDLEVFRSKTSYEPTVCFRGIACRDGNTLLAMVGYDYWTHNSVQMHIYIGNALALRGRKFIQEAFRFPFESGRNKVIAVTPANQESSIKLSEFLGFRETGRIADGWDVGVDMVIFEMTKDECVWLKPLPESTTWDSSVTSLTPTQ